MRLALGLVGMLTAAAVFACTTDYQKGLDDVTYAGPNSLNGQEPPGATVDQGGAASSTGGAAGGPKCGTPVPTPAGCTITFKTEVVAALQAGSCGAGVGCHAKGGVPPLVDLADPDGTYAALTNFTASKGIYVNPCSIDPTQSAIVANLDPANPERGSVMPPGVGLPAAVAVVKQWVECGSPK